MHRAVLLALPLCVACGSADAVRLAPCAGPEAPVVRALPVDLADVAPAPIGGLRAVNERIDFRPEVYRLESSGRAVVQTVVDADGRVVCTEVLQSAGRIFDLAARRALHRSPFTPAQRDGRPVAVVMEFPFSYRVGTTREAR